MLQTINYMEKPPLIYKYTRINENLKSSLRESYIWFSKSDSLNDPFDLAYPPGVHKEITTQRMVVLLNQMREKGKKMKDKLPDGIDVDGAIDNMINYIGSKEYDDFFETRREQIIEKIPFAVCCFTEEYNNMLMWSHYADNHKGVCMMYYLQEDPELFKVLAKVVYSGKLPLTNDIQYDTVISLLTKSPEWHYEREWRILQLTSGKASINRACLKGIRFGCNTKDETIQDVINTCNESGYDWLSFYKMEKTDGFKLLSRDI